MDITRAEALRVIIDFMENWFEHWEWSDKIAFKGGMVNHKIAIWYNSSAKCRNDNYTRYDGVILERVNQRSCCEAFTWDEILHTVNNRPQQAALL